MQYRRCITRLIGKRTIVSEKNGPIMVTRFFGSVKVIVAGYEQSGRYLRLMWRDALQRVPETVAVRRVLLLGLGGGISIGEIHLRFHDVTVTAVEWDPMMVDIAQNEGLIREAEMPKIIVGDAFAVLTTLTQQFDLILIDIFHGGTPDSRLAKSDLVRLLARVLAPNGCLILNAYKTRAFLPVFAEHFVLNEQWHYRDNILARMILPPS